MKESKDNKENIKKDIDDVEKKKSSFKKKKKIKKTVK